MHATSRMTMRCTAATRSVSQQPAFPKIRRFGGLHDWPFLLRCAFPIKSAVHRGFNVVGFMPARASRSRPLISALARGSLVQLRAAKAVPLRGSL
jgi:hypothetical protein